MFKRYLLSAFALAAVIITGCSKDFLDRSPISEVSPNQYFKTQQDLEIYSNGFYTMLPNTGIYTDDTQSDNVDPQTISDLMAGRTIVQNDASAAGWTWTELRNINFFLENYNRAQISDSVKAHYAGIGRFFRAVFYFNKLMRFGDVPWYSTSLNAGSPELYKARDPRVLVVDSIIADLNFAVQHVYPTKNVSRITRWAALALKSRVCLYEGTYRKYHTSLGLGSSASALLDTAAATAFRLIKEGGYILYSTNNPGSDYGNLFTQEAANPSEVILSKVYDKTLALTHTANGVFTSATLGAPGLTKDMIDSYLTADGKPFSSVPGYNTMPFTAEVKNRDPRLAQTIRTPGYIRKSGGATLLPDFDNAPTGYQCIKWVMGTDQDGYQSNTNDIIIFRLAEVMLNYAEARAENGKLDQADVTLALDPIRKRAGLPLFQLNGLQADPILLAQYTQTTDPLILEVRRERRVELAMEGFRRNDLLRWQEGSALIKVFRGMYFPTLGYYDFNGDGTNDFGIFEDMPTPQLPNVEYVILKPNFKLTEGTKGNLIVHPNETKKFDEGRDYLFPLPINEMLLNPKLEQNPKWTK
ncbi:RagB/SusD family nutrient uptake outer membrane protein [Chitinophaga sp. SYP-B3965]|uniref:RagB/SusD family nutrient uptake outer membrane protein n=1 Tax=Chitinophaga sp. SYP-B3965 TaxID=2663120 RepID=UPI001299C8CE|nr:RagB/SusD family nutrient uptake outer membrane protein [Chitinophaga sp. SYP-B3965]MRG47918.1 RagB/SusD family nutrient uptake outer membrane protein [Chitinophaga sp. SYP-B3965]